MTKPPITEGVPFLLLLLHPLPRFLVLLFFVGDTESTDNETLQRRPIN